jgi:mono/diheme cytochrome c family protein
MRRLAGAMALVVLTGAAPAQADDAVDPLLVEMGAEAYQQYCTACHGLGGRGDGPAVPALKTPPPDLTQIAARRGGNFPAGEIAKFIDGRFTVAAHGSREMPIWGEHFGQDIPEAGVSESVVRGTIATLVEYLKSIQAGD